MKKKEFVRSGLKYSRLCLDTPYSPMINFNKTITLLFSQGHTASRIQKQNGLCNNWQQKPFFFCVKLITCQYQ